MKLFQRTGGGLTLTESGAHYLEMLSHAFAEIDSATRQVLGIERAGRLTVRSTPSLASRWLLPRLPLFLDAHRDIDVRIEATSEPLDFRAQQIDVAIWYARARWPEGVASRPLLAERVLPLCNPALRNGARPLHEPSDLRHYTLIHTRRNIITWKAWLSARDVTLPATARNVSIDPSALAIEAAANGLGVVLESDVLAAHEIESGALEPALDGAAAVEAVSYHLVYPADRATDPAVETFVAWLVATAGGGHAQRISRPATRSA